MAPATAAVSATVKRHVRADIQPTTGLQIGTIVAYATVLFCVY